MIKSFLFMTVGLVDVLLVLFFIILPVALFIWALVDLLKSRFADRRKKLIWVIIILFVPYVGPILYLVIGKRYKRLKT